MILSKVVTYRMHRYAIWRKYVPVSLQKTRNFCATWSWHMPVTVTIWPLWRGQRNKRSVGPKRNHEKRGGESWSASSSNLKAMPSPDSSYSSPRRPWRHGRGMGQKDGNWRPKISRILPASQSIPVTGLRWISVMLLARRQEIGRIMAREPYLGWPGICRKRF